MVASSALKRPPTDRILNGFSVDVEDWYQVSDFMGTVKYDEWDDYESRVERNTHKILSLLEDAGDVKGTFFVLTWNAERHPEVVRAIAHAGHEIASHGHAHRLVYEQTPEEFREDVRRAKSILEDLTGQPILGYRAPSFSVTTKSLWALDVLLEEGYRYDASVFPVKDALYGLPGAERFPYVALERDGKALLEVPMTTTTALGRNLPLGGGGYLRVLPYRYMWWGMRRVNKQDGQSAFVYIHPWEVDPDQPRMQSTGKRGFSTHYMNLHRTERRLRKLLRHFDFAPIRDVVGLA